MATDVIIGEVVSVEEIERYEPNKLRHIINPTKNLHLWKPELTSQDIVDIARVRGIPVMALCGVEFIPTQNPEDVKKTCDGCVEIAGFMINHPPEND